MTTFINQREAAALREDSLSSLGNTAIMRLRPQPARIYGPVRARLRHCGGPRPLCRACGKRIENRTPVISFRWVERPWRDVAYIHQECPKQRDEAGQFTSQNYLERKRLDELGSGHGAD